MSELAIEVADLWVAYRRKSRRGRRRRERSWALRGIELQAAPGDMLGLVGPNGAGKTTLLQTTMGVIRPSRGTVRTRGRVASLIDLSAGLHREFTGRENILAAGVLLGMSRAEVRKRYEDIAAFAELDQTTLDSPFRTYSAGMGLRLCFALATCGEPRVLVVDEVLAVGDESFRRKCFGRIGELRGRGCAVLLASHDVSLVSSACDDVAILVEGQIKFRGPVNEAFERYFDLEEVRSPGLGSDPEAHRFR